MTRAFPLSLLLLSAPAAAAPRLDALLAQGEALTRAADATCSTPLEAAALAAEKSDDDYARALGALGLCREVQGRYGEAHGLVSRALESAPAETTPAGRAPRWTTLRAALRRLDDRVARVLVTWPEGAELYVDGRSAGGVSGRVLAVTPGRRLFEARRDGKAVAAQEVEARAGDLPAVKLQSAPPGSSFSTSNEVPKQEPALPKPSPFAPALSPRGVSVSIAYGAAGVALVSGIVAGVLEAQRVSLASGLSSGACAPPVTASRCEALRLAFDQRTGARNVALVAGGIAVAAGGVAVVLWATGERKATAGVVIGGAW